VDTLEFNPIEEIIAALRNGEMVVVADDPGRENEADLIAAASLATPETINFMAVHARGLICAPISHERTEALDLPQMTQHNRETQRTAFTVSVDAASGVTTGISAPTGHGPSACSPTNRSAPMPSSNPATSSRSKPWTAECSGAPATPRRPSTSPASPNCRPPA